MSAKLAIHPKAAAPLDPKVLAKLLKALNRSIMDLSAIRAELFPHEAVPVPILKRK